MDDNGEVTSVASATSKSKSLRTTIPAGIARQFKLSEGSKLSWQIEARENNQLVIVIKPLKSI
jgi:bifunctional DNA-binding transcriptional regulator/antitoxin component of YhaV-PrlF toxin-antitoxin module